MLGETEEMEPNAEKTITLDLKPGPEKFYAIELPQCERGQSENYLLTRCLQEIYHV